MKGSNPPVVFKLRPRPGFEIEHTPTTEDRFAIQMFAGVEGQTLQLAGELQLKLQEWNVLQMMLRPLLVSTEPGVKVISNASDGFEEEETRI